METRHNLQPDGDTEFIMLFVWSIIVPLSVQFGEEPGKCVPSVHFNII